MGTRSSTRRPLRKRRSKCWRNWTLQHRCMNGPNYYPCHHVLPLPSTSTRMTMPSPWTWRRTFWSYKKKNTTGNRDLHGDESILSNERGFPSTTDLSSVMSLRRRGCMMNPTPSATAFFRTCQASYSMLPSAYWTGPVEYLRRQKNGPLATCAPSKG